MTTTNMIDLITQFRVLMFDYFPYISHYNYSLNPVPVDGLGTMAVDKTGTMYYDPDWAETLTLEEGGYVCLHEAWHLILRHCHRAKHIVGPTPTQQQMYDLNIAADIIVWEMMESVAHMAPKGGVTLANAQERWPAIKANMTLQELYSIIHNDAKEDGFDGKDEPGKEDGEGDGKEDGSQKSEESKGREKGGKPDRTGTADGDESGDDSTEPSRDGGNGRGSEGGDGSGSGSEESVDNHGYENVVKGSAADGVRKDFEKEQNDAWETYMEESLLEKTEQSIEVLENTDPNWSPSRGRIPGRLKRVIKQRLHPTVNPWDRLKDVIAKALSQYGGRPEPTFLKRNRRQSCMQRNVVLPGERRYQPNVAVIMDTSGSMTRQCLSKAAAICEQGTKSVGQYRLVCWDDGLQFDGIIRGSKTDWPAPGGGGTCMTSAIEYVFENTKGFGKADVVICVTDGGTGWPDEMPNGSKLIIALTQDWGKQPDWSVVVKVPDPGKTPEEPEE